MTDTGNHALDHAQQLAKLGLNVLPAGRGQKAPTQKWVEWQTRRTDDQLAVWFSNSVPSNYWAMTGRMSGIAVLDCDNTDTIRWWDAKLGGSLLLVHQVRTAKGRHFYFRLPEGPLRDEGFASWSVHRPDTLNGAAIELSFDLRCNGAGVIAAGSVHETGLVYDWVFNPGHKTPGAPTELDALYDVPDELLSAVAAGLADSSDSRVDGSGQTRSILTKLLTNVPAEGGRNDWLTRVAGHYAKEYRTRKDAYQYHVGEAAAKTDLDGAEVTKITDSVWRKEQSSPTGPDDAAPDWDPINETRQNPIRVREVNEDSGWLLSGSDGVIMCQVRHKTDENEVVYGLEPWADFDMVARGVVDDPDESVPRAYDVTVIRKRDGARRDGLLYSRDLSDNRTLSKWLAQHGVSIVVPDSVYPKAGTQSARLQRYLEAQKPPMFEVTDCLGWDDGQAGFICHEGVIRASGLEPFGQVRPAPHLRNRASYRYGYQPGDEGRAAAKSVLNEILTFHDIETAGVFGAWWAASLVKPLISRRVSQFPFMALEAPAESGKTRGMFSMLIELAGNSRGQSLWTMASMRDAIASHNSGIVWADDSNDIEHILELIRSATGGGSYAKMAENRTDTVAVHLVAPICVSGEALGIGDQKATRDRAITLGVKSPSGRRSVTRPVDAAGNSRAQWLDVMALKEAWPDLNDLAGNVVALAVEAAGLEATAEAVDRMRGAYAGKRVADKLAVLRVGARVLARMTDDPSWVDVVDHWVDGVSLDDIDANTVELKLIPAALARFDYPVQPEPAMQGRPATPVFITTEQENNPYDDRLPGTGPTVRNCPRVHVSARNLSDWWSATNHGRISQRTESEAAITAQLRAIPGIEKRRIRVQASRSAQVTYWALPAEASRAIVARAREER